VPSHFPSSGDCLPKAQEALALAKEHLGAAKALADAGFYSQAFGLLVYCSEEQTKAAILLYVHLDLVTFDRGQALQRRYFNWSWLQSHPRKHVEFGRDRAMQVMQTGAMLLLLGATGDPEQMKALLTGFALVAVTFGAWTERFEDQRELAFHSGPPVSGRTDIARPGKQEYDSLLRFVQGALAHLEPRFKHPLDKDAIEQTLPNRKWWSRYVAGRPREAETYPALAEFVESMFRGAGPKERATT
jgi:AbiV family abortive infection protein